MIDVIGFPVRMRLNDKGACIHQIRQLFGFPHGHDLRMRPIPFFLQTVDQKICPLVGELHPGKHLDPDFLSVCRRLLVIGKIKLDLVCIMHCPGIGADVPVQEMVGDEDPVISDLFVKADRIFCRRTCALAYRRCMAMCFVPVHFSSPLMRDAAFFLLRGRFLSVLLSRWPFFRGSPAQLVFESRRRESVLDERESA